MRWITILLTSTFIFLCVGFANSQTGGEQIYQNSSKWNLLVGTCQLKVKTSGTQVLFQPSSASGSLFLGSVPDAKDADVPLDLVSAHSVPGGVVHEVLHLRFADENGRVQPIEYNLTRIYLRDQQEVQRLETNCADLKPLSL
jgi:hypothetical protein